MSSQLTAVLVIGPLVHDPKRLPQADCAVHVFRGGDLIATNKFPEVPVQAQCRLENFLFEYTNGKCSTLHS